MRRFDICNRCKHFTIKARFERGDENINITVHSIESYDKWSDNTEMPLVKKDIWCQLYHNEDGFEYEADNFINRGLPRNCPFKLEQTVMNQDEKQD